MKNIDIEELEARGKEMASRTIEKPDLNKAQLLRPIIDKLLTFNEPISKMAMNRLKKEYKFSGKNSYLFQAYKLLYKEPCENDEAFRKSLQIKACKSWSGITSITVFTAAYPEYTDSKTGQRIKQNFTCNWACSFCPDQKGQPRSYVLNEPGVLRANRFEFDCVKQVQERMHSLYDIGHQDLGKLELLVLGGTFASYPIEYREEFARDIYYAANTFWDKLEEKEMRKRMTLQEEKHINKTAKSRVIGLTIETRGDTITPEELRFYRKIGCTRLQIGIQHVDDDVLNANNRKCPHKKSVQAIKMLKQNGWKIDGHFMPNLPFTTVEKDKKMLLDHLAGLKNHIKRHKEQDSTNWEKYNLFDPDTQVDQVKIYPCAVVVYTEIEKWFKEGKYIPYPEKEFVDMMYTFKTLVFPWIRINRVVRDFFADTIYSESGGNLSLRSELTEILKKGGLSCNCIRCREVKDKDWDGTYELFVREYNASDGKEYFISAESRGVGCNLGTIYGFVRLRLDDGQTDKVFPELIGAALIREVHVYSQLTNVGDKGKHVQHRGIGTKLVQKAEQIAKKNGYSKMSVISGIGAQTFYEKIGYALAPGDGEFMMKSI